VQDCPSVIESHRLQLTQAAVAGRSRTDHQSYDMFTVNMYVVGLRLGSPTKCLELLEIHAEKRSQGLVSTLGHFALFE
jgi:hypothetical protein